jgi:phage gp29-like protein
MNIPSWKLLMFVNEQEGENYEGISILRTAYKHWYYKEQYYRIDAMAQERQGLGLPFFKKPNGATPKDVAEMRKLMRNLRSNEESYLEIPMGWEVGLVEMKAQAIKDAEPMISHHDRQITKNVLAQFLELGSSGGSGSRALSEDHSDLFLLSEEAVAKHIQEVVQKDLIKELVDYNFTVDCYPELHHGQIGIVDYQKLSASLQQLSGAKMITTNYELEKYLRKTMKLPEIEQDEYDKIHEQMRQDLFAIKTPQLPSNQQKNNTTNEPNSSELQKDQNGNTSQQNQLHATENVVNDVIKFSEAIKHAITKKTQS